MASAQPGESGLDLSALLRSGFSDDEIQRLRRLRREGSPERLSRSWRLVRQRVTTGPWSRPDSPGVPLPIPDLKSIQTINNKERTFNMENKVNVYFFGKKYSVPAELTIMTAMEYAGYT